MKIGIFGGSFDPIHLGHINLIIQIKEQKQLDKILFCPTFVSPFKQKNPPKASSKHRLEMLKIAIEPLDFAEIIDLEIKKAGPSYTIDTLRKLQEMFPKDDLFLVAGEDVLDHFSYWKEPENIVKIAKPLIGSRKQQCSSLKNLENSLKTIFETGFCPIKNFDISSTDIRERLQKKLYCGHLLLTKVIDYIHKHELYYNTKIE